MDPGPPPPSSRLKKQREHKAVVEAVEVEARHEQLGNLLITGLVVLAMWLADAPTWAWLGMGIQTQMIGVGFDRVRIQAWIIEVGRRGKL